MEVPIKSVNVMLIKEMRNNTERMGDPAPENSTAQDCCSKTKNTQTCTHMHTRTHTGDTER